MNFKNIFFQLIALCGLLFFAAYSKEEREAPQLTVSSAEELFAATGGNSDVTVTSNTGWTASSDAAWVTVTASNTIGIGKIGLSVKPNETATERTTTITVTAGSLKKEVRVRQLGKSSTDSIPPDQTGMRNLSSLALAQELKIGWNLGNSLEAIGGETAWGNPLVTQQLIDAIKAAGFTSVRIPVAWSRFTDATTFKIDPAWKARVEEVVNYVLKNKMYAIINMHWDGGWMQPTYAKQEYVNNRLRTMWQQVAIRFRNYDDHLLFAGTNEVMVDGDYGTPKQEYYTVQNSFNQTFVTAVRATGGRNAYRHLVVQGFNTNIDHAVNFLTVPTDPTSQRMMVEVHYYDPYNFSLNENSNITQWGKDATDGAKTETWANEAYVDAQFQKVKTKFIDKGYPVILGGYGAIARLNLGSDAANTEHATYRKYYTEYVTGSAKRHGLVPFYWDNGFTGDKGLGIFNRATGAVAYPEILKAITGN